MDPRRTISEENFKRIQVLAEPLVDTLDTALSRILDSYERSKGSGSAKPAPAPTSVILPSDHPYDPNTPPDLTHTKVTFAAVGGRHLDNPTWNAILDEVIRTAKRRLDHFTAVKRVTPINIFEGEKNIDGYHYLKDVGLSVQGQSANDAWRAIGHIARALGCEVQANFFWRNKESAFRPGEGGYLVIEGRK